MKLEKHYPLPTLLHLRYLITKFSFFFWLEGCLSRTASTRNLKSEVPTAHPVAIILFRELFVT